MSNMQPPHAGPAPSGNPKADAKAAKAYAKASRPWYKMKRYWLLAFFLLIVVIAAMSGGGGGAEGTASDGGDTAAAADDNESKSNERAEKAVKVEAKKILNEFEENEAAADAKYDDKVLQVSGVVDKIDTEVWDDEQYVIRVGAGTDFEFIHVNCNDQSQSDVTSIKKGQDITVVGKFDDGGDLGVELKDCKVA